MLVGLSLAIALTCTGLRFGPVGQWLEREFARQWLIDLRGERPPPDDVLVIALEDKLENDRQLLPRFPIKHDRRLYALLIDKLSLLDASVIVIDVNFEQASSAASDALLAAAIARSDRTILFQRLARTAEGDRVIPVLPALEQAAEHLAVFPLPKLPTLVESYWPWFSARALHPSSHESKMQIRPTLPTAALLLHADRSADSEQILSGLERHSRLSLLNFYGPARTITTLEHRRLLKMQNVGEGSLRRQIANKVIFVGYSGLDAVDQVDGFATVYSRADGVDLSGVEIAATALANMLDGSVLEHASVLQMLFYFALVSAALLWSLGIRSTTLALTVTVCLAGIAMLFAVYAFERHHVLYPIGIVLGVQLPLIVLIGSLVKAVLAHRRRERLRMGASMLLPRVALGTIERGTVESDMPEPVLGTCLLTDVAGYTTLAESVGSERLAELSNAYFQVLTRITHDHSGELIDLEGDSMMAFWAHENADSSSALAAQAAVAIAEGVQRFNAEHPNTPFRTRIGLSRGWVSAGNIGGSGIYRYRTIGDTVNTASRLEQLNRTLGTTILATNAVVEGSSALVTRSMGRFVLKGKKRAVGVVEIVGLAKDVDAGSVLLTSEFRQLHEELRCGAMQEVRSRLEKLKSRFPDDGPTAFYLKLLGSGNELGHVQLSDRGAIVMSEK